ncbi:hypothetical protein E2C01_025677 [Portunus trituberculatus]|uniref:Uncharacterized protein n=1 Tax=Portunus trituberculatus TaxID=210409 RepID=A0A5B7EGK4_PORTR|nr:hypothetical protein [Portunus trituberculatus]
MPQGCGHDSLPRTQPEALSIFPTLLHNTPLATTPPLLLSETIDSNESQHNIYQDARVSIYNNQ